MQIADALLAREVLDAEQVQPLAAGQPLDEPRRPPPACRPRRRRRARVRARRSAPPIVPPLNKPLRRNSPSRHQSAGVSRRRRSTPSIA